MTSTRHNRAYGELILTIDQRLSLDFLDPWCGQWFYDSILEVASFVPRGRRRNVEEYSVFARTRDDALRRVLSGYGIKAVL